MPMEVQRSPQYNGAVMRFIVAFGLAISAVTSPGMACDCLSPVAEKWASCAVHFLPARDTARAEHLWEVRNKGHIDHNNHVDRAGERRWLSRWRSPLARACGSLAVVNRTPDGPVPRIPNEGLDEIYVIGLR